jgi:hypothetical protein
MQKFSTQLRLLNLKEWRVARYSPGSAPSVIAVRRWIRIGLIYPAPIKQGRAYYFHPDAEYMDPARPRSELIRRLKNGTPA